MQTPKHLAEVEPYHERNTNMSAGADEAVSSESTSRVLVVFRKGKKHAQYLDFMFADGNKEKYNCLYGAKQYKETRSFLRSLIDNAKTRFRFCKEGRDGLIPLTDDEIYKKTAALFYRKPKDPIKNLRDKLAKHLSGFMKELDELDSKFDELDSDLETLEEVKSYRDYISNALKKSQLPSIQEGKKKENRVPVQEICNRNTSALQGPTKPSSAMIQQDAVISPPSEVLSNLAEKVAQMDVKDANDGVTFQTHDTCQSIVDRFKKLNPNSDAGFKAKKGTNTVCFTAQEGTYVKWSNSKLNGCGMYHGMLNEKKLPSGLGVVAYTSGNFFYGVWENGKRQVGSYVHMYSEKEQLPYPIIYEGKFDKENRMVGDYSLCFGEGWNRSPHAPSRGKKRGQMEAFGKLYFPTNHREI